MITRETKTFVCSYNWDGAAWSFQINAYDFDDCRQRIRRIGDYGCVDGEHVITVRQSWIPTWLIEMICAIRNWFVP